MFFVSIFCVAFIVTIFLITSLLEKKKYTNLDNKHVLITGGSSGIGKAAAVEAAKLGANVSIVGRDIDKLTAAVSEIRSYVVNEQQKIQYVSLDVTSIYETIENSLKTLETQIGPIFMLVNCAGMCICGKFEEMEVKDINKMIELNYFGTAYPTKFVLPGMKTRKEGIIVFVSSEAALIGIYGYTAYSAGKWAVRGLAEALLMELVSTGVNLMISFPPDTDTPGFKNEELTKPSETKLISGSGGLHSPEKVGKRLIHDALVGKTYSVYSLSGKLMSLLYCGSIESASQVLIQIFSMGFLRMVMVGVLLSFHKIVRDSLKSKSLHKNDKDN